MCGARRVACLDRREASASSASFCDLDRDERARSHVADPAPNSRSAHATVHSRRDQSNSTAHMDPSHYADAQAFRANFKDIRTSARARAARSRLQHSFAHGARSTDQADHRNSSDARRQASMTSCRRRRRSASSCTRSSSALRLVAAPAGLNILMEYANGGSLQHEIVGRSKGPFWYDEDLILDYLVQMVSALAVVQVAGIVHRIRAGERRLHVGRAQGVRLRHRQGARRLGDVRADVRRLAVLRRSSR